MSVYGSAFSGGYKQSPLAQALANSGKALGDGIQQGVAGYVDGRQKQAAMDLEREKMKAAEKLENTRLETAKETALTGRIDQVNAQYDQALLDGVPEADAARIRDAQIQKIRPNPTGPTGVGKITNPPVQAAPQGDPTANVDAINAQFQKDLANGVPEEQARATWRAKLAGKQQSPAEEMTMDAEGNYSVKPPKTVGDAINTPPVAQAPAITAAPISFGSARAAAKAKAEQDKIAATTTAEGEKNKREVIEKNKFTISNTHGVSPDDLKNDPIYSMYDRNTLEGSEAILGEAAKRTARRQDDQALKRAQNTGVIAADKAAVAERVKSVPEASPSMVSFNASKAAFESSYTKLEQEIAAGDYTAARATAQTMKGQINSLNGQGAMGSEEASGLMGGIDTFIKSDPEQYRVGRDWEGLKRDFRGQSTVLNDVQARRYLDAGLTLSGKVKVILPDGRAEAVTPARAKEIIQSNPGAYTEKWASIEQVRKY